MIKFMIKLKKTMIKISVIVLLLFNMATASENADLAAYIAKSNPSPRYFIAKKTSNCYEWHKEPFNSQIDFTVKINSDTTAQTILDIVLQGSHPVKLDCTKFIITPLDSPIGAYSLNDETLTDIENIYKTSCIRIIHDHRYAPRRFLNIQLIPPVITPSGEKPFPF